MGADIRYGLATKVTFRPAHEGNGSMKIKLIEAMLSYRTELPPNGWVWRSEAAAEWICVSRLRCL